MKELIYAIANDVYWKSFADFGFWVFVIITIAITEVLFGFIHVESKAYVLGDNFSLQYSLIFFGLFTLIFYPVIHYFGEKKRRKIRDGG